MQTWTITKKDSFNHHNLLKYFIKQEIPKTTYNKYLHHVTNSKDIQQLNRNKCFSFHRCWTFRSTTNTKRKVLWCLKCNTDTKSNIWQRYPLHPPLYQKKLYINQILPTSAQGMILVFNTQNYTDGHPCCHTDNTQLKLEQHVCLVGFR